MIDDVGRNKSEIIRRCLARVREEYAGDPVRLSDPTHQDALVLNLQRACEAAIDLAMHVVARDALGIPQSSRDAFAILERAGRISPATSTALQRMVGFRNLAVHDYRALSLPILQTIVESRLGDFETLIGELR